MTNEDSSDKAISPGVSPLGFGRRVAATARNVAEVVRFGGLETGEEASPYEVESEQLNFRLRHYFAKDVAAGAQPIVLVPPLMLAAEIWDVSPGSSAVQSLHGEGIDVWVVDFGDPRYEKGGLERTLTDHVIAVSSAIDQVCAATGKDVVLAGYSQGGMFAYQTAAFRRGEGIDSLVTFGSPVDARAPLPFPISPEIAARATEGLLESGLLKYINVPSWASRTGFKLLSPAKSVQSQVKFLLALHDRESLLPRERQRQFLEREGFTAWSGPALAELLEIFVAHNRMLQGGFSIEDQMVTLADIDVPILTVVGVTDTIGHPDSVRAINRAAPRAEVYEMTLWAGHFGLVVGSTANLSTWPGVAAWVKWRADGTPLPEEIVPADQVEHKPMLGVGAGAATVVQAAEFGMGAGLLAFGSAKRAIGVARGLVSSAPTQLPRLARLEQLDQATPISLGLLLDEQARKSPMDTSFLFEDRAHRQADVKTRVDSVVKGLVSVGIRQGDRVGVLMRTRPSAFTLVAALSRLGATAVMLRPESDLKREAALGQITWVVSDPEHVDGVEVLDSVTWCVLGGGADSREMHPGVVDMERIDPDKVELPAWYRPNPHRAGDIAFILFTGRGSHLKASRITNRRWAMSALGTASAAALKPGDTVYCTTPIYHSSAILMSIGGAIAGNARFALATAHDPDTFWEEVRRYGTTHVSYTWTSLRAVTLAPPNPAEKHHSIRLFMGSGMPPNLWRRVVERFPTSRVLEFYASAEGDAILANVKGLPIGSMGKSLPGTPQVKVAAFDLETRSLELGPDGLGREAATDEVGLLLSRVLTVEAMTGIPFRSVFGAGDSWRSTGDLFRRDEHQDLWHIEPLSGLITTDLGVIAPSEVSREISNLPAVDLCVTFGVPHDGQTVLVSALTLRKGAKITADALQRALNRLPASHHPDFVQTVPSIPVTTWHRPMWTELQKAGIPKPTTKRHVWRLDAARKSFEQL
ncbi:MAG: alpha/beta fold hydrolase [Aeromicrobium sp.]